MWSDSTVLLGTDLDYISTGLFARQLMRYRFTFPRSVTFSHSASVVELSHGPPHGGDEKNLEKTPGEEVDKLPKSYVNVPQIWIFYAHLKFGKMACILVRNLQMPLIQGMHHYTLMKGCSRRFQSRVLPMT